jgi:hypothetical protein
MFNPNQLFIMIKADDVIKHYKIREQGLTHTLTIDLGKSKNLMGLFRKI